MFQGKICHFEFTFSVITIVLVILSSWNLVWVCFFGWKWPYGISDFRFFLLVTVLVLKNTCGWIDDWKKNVLFSFYKYQPITETKMTFGSFLGTSKWWYKVKYIFLKWSQRSLDRKWITIVKVNLLEESHRNYDKISGCCQLYEIHTFHGVSLPPLPTHTHTNTHFRRGTWKF